MLANGSQFPFQDAFPNHPPSNISAEPLGLNNLVDDIWDLRRKQERRFDPLFYLGDDVMHEVLLNVVNLWDIAESRAWGTEVISRHYISDPLVLMSVSWQWSRFITSSSQLWSYLFIDTDGKDIMEYLQLFFLLSRNRRLFIILHGSGDVCDGIVMNLLRVGDRIDTLVYPPNTSHSTFAKFWFYLGTSQEQLERVCPWYKLEVQSVIQPPQYVDPYLFPTSLQSLWMDGLFPLPELGALSYFRSLSFLSVNVALSYFRPPSSFDMDGRPAHRYTLELPNLKRFRLRAAVACYREVKTPILMICRKLKVLDLQYALEYNPESMSQAPETWMKFDIVDTLEELHIDVAIHVEPEDRLIVALAKWLEMRVLQREKWLEQQQQRLEQERRWPALEELDKLEEEGMRELEGELYTVKNLHMRRSPMWLPSPSSPSPHAQGAQLKQEQWNKQIWQQEQHLLFVMSLRMDWRDWLNLPDHLEHVRQSSLKVTLSTQMHKEAWGNIRNTLEEVLVWRLPQLTELTTSKVLHIFPKHLRKLRFHGFAMGNSWPSITLPSLVSLEIIADSPDHLLVMRYLRVPQLRVLRVQVVGGPGTLHKHYWGDEMNNKLDHISLRIEMPRYKQGNHSLFFSLPQTHSLNVFSPYMSLRLYLTRPAPLFYTLNAGLGTVSGPSRGDIKALSAMWNEEWVTEWINPYGIPDLVIFRTLTSLQRIVLDQRPYLLSKQSPTDTLFKLLEQNIHTCPQLISITLAQCPSSWPQFLCQLRKRNREAILSKGTKCIEELRFYQPLHAAIIRWLVDAIKAKNLDVMERPPIREGNAWPMRPLEAEHIFRSCYVCHITGMELGCFEYETQNVDCGRQRDDGSKIVVS